MHTYEHAAEACLRHGRITSVEPSAELVIADYRGRRGARRGEAG